MSNTNSVLRDLCWLDRYPDDEQATARLEREFTALRRQHVRQIQDGHEPSNIEFAALVKEAADAALVEEAEEEDRERRWKAVMRACGRIRTTQPAGVSRRAFSCPLQCSKQSCLAALRHRRRTQSSVGSMPAALLSCSLHSPYVGGCRV